MNDEKFKECIDKYLKYRLKGIEIEICGPESGLEVNDLEHEQKMALFFWEYMLKYEPQITDLYVNNDDETAYKLVGMLHKIWDSRGLLEMRLSKEKFKVTFEMRRQDYYELLRVYQEGNVISFGDMLEKFNIENETEN